MSNIVVLTDLTTEEQLADFVRFNQVYLWEKQIPCLVLSMPHELSKTVAGRFLLAVDYYETQNDKQRRGGEWPDWLRAFANFSVLHFERPENVEIAFYTLTFMFVALRNHYVQNETFKTDEARSALDNLFQQADEIARSMDDELAERDLHEGFLTYQSACFLYLSEGAGDSLSTYKSAAKHFKKYYERIKHTANEAIVRMAASWILKMFNDCPTMYSGMSLEEVISKELIEEITPLAKRTS